MATALRPIAHDDRLSLVEHLDELRSRIIICLVIVSGAFAICFWQNDRILDIMDRPLQKSAFHKDSQDPLEQSAAFQQSLKEGYERSTIEGIVHRQILYPNRMAQFDPQTGKQLPSMPADLVEGEDAEDVAAYVAMAASAPGEDTGRLAKAGQTQNDKVAQEEGGTLDIPTVASGALAYQFGSAEAKPGAITINSKNDASIPHDIAIEGNGVEEKGEVVQGGGTSTLKADLKPGDYTFYCSVPGHREGGMQGKIVVK